MAAGHAACKRCTHLVPVAHSVDCLPLINRQLDGILMLSRRLQTCNKCESRLKLHSNICNRAVLHVMSRECVLLPAWRRARWKDFPLASFQAHVRLKHALAELVIRPPLSEGHSAAMDAFADQVIHQRALDRGYLVPMLRSAMDAPQIRDLCNEIERLFEADGPVDELSPCIDTSPRDLVQEAAVILSSLAPHREIPMSARGSRGRTGRRSGAGHTPGRQGSGAAA